MSLNIKNERTHALVRELAELTGMSQTSAVEDAVRRRLKELQTDAGARGGRPAPKYPPEEVERRIAAIKRISAAFVAETTPEQREAMRNHADWLYDEFGLPK
ncbi:type II toxin-antitoxin system VapB family antitoxin [Microbacterium sp. NEAU-LLC]|uniref:Type II toxin-antitoxin system VapB family antitoxin n=1 Tax=Microbacterium helvum TaxID=2773713 RepID=A0ABR8NNK5_9MICO|nr:type II toxin-antitoxin system VapB family antitoxin [Microbacterium helvum]MBD3942244.1 type II toxin-antitoxin system VapB family antitoxin [Microbacterium helvum]